MRATKVATVKRIILNTADAYQDNLDHMNEFISVAREHAWSWEEIESSLLYKLFVDRQNRIRDGALYVQRDEMYHECDASGFVLSGGDCFDIVPR